MERIEIPLDSEGYATSFNISESSAAKKFFDSVGFVVFRDVYSDSECSLSRNAMWDHVEAANPSCSRNDRRTWVGMKATGKYGLSSRGPVFSNQLICNRQSENLAKALSCIIGTDPNDIIISHDRFTIYRSTLCEASDESHIHHSTFLTGRKNVHIDLNPWWYLESSHDIIKGLESLKYDNPQDFIRENNLVVQAMGRHLQCVLNFADNRDEDGGTILVPGFHLLVSQWAEENRHLRRNIPWLEFPPKSTGDKEEKERPSTSSLPPGPEEEYLLARAQRIPMREGSVLMWDQTVAHGSAPNNSTQCRYAQFLKAYSRRASFMSDERIALLHHGQNKTIGTSSISGKGKEDLGEDKECVSSASVNPKQHVSSTSVHRTARLVRRARALRKHLLHSGAWDSVTELGSHLFGLDVLDDDRCIQSANTDTS